MTTHFRPQRILAALTLLLTGCASTGFFKLHGDFVKESPKNPVMRILTMWQPSEGTWEGRTVRGVAGQIYFFGLNSSAPLKVDGEAVIEVFDSQGTPGEQAKPFHKFEFTREAWNAHLAKGALGATYDFFIPYTRKGKHEAQMGLLVRYISNDGRTLDSELVNVTLEGTKTQKPAETQQEYGLVPHQDQKSGKPAAANAAGGGLPGNSPDVAAVLPSREELEKLSGRVKSKPLTAKEQKRILREARGKLGLDGKRAFVSAEDDDVADEIGEADFEEENRDTQHPRSSTRAERVDAVRHPHVHEPEAPVDDWE